MELLHVTLNIGVKKPFSFLDISDSHISVADGRDSEAMQVQAAARARHFAGAEEKLQTAINYARQNDLLIAHTGDYIDFITHANLDHAKQFMQENDVFFVAGNHEFCWGEFDGTLEDAAYREKSLAMINEAYGCNTRFHSRVVNGVNFVAIDNGYYLFDAWQLEALRQEVAKGLPILLFMHDPLYDPELFDRACAEVAKNTKDVICSYLVGVPEEKLRLYPPMRYNQQKPDTVTLETVEYIKSQPLIKAIFAGHLHEQHHTMLTPALPQYIPGIDAMYLVDVI